jgi:hypothetical protein
MDTDITLIDQAKRRDVNTTPITAKTIFRRFIPRRSEGSTRDPYIIPKMTLVAFTASLHGLHNLA